MLKLPEEMSKWTSQRERGGGGERQEKTPYLFSPLPLPPFLFCPRTYRMGYYFYSPQSSMHSHKLKDGNYNNITNTNKVSPTQNTSALQATALSAVM